MDLVEIRKKAKSKKQKPGKKKKAANTEKTVSAPVEEGDTQQPLPEKAEQTGSRDVPAESAESEGVPPMDNKNTTPVEEPEEILGTLKSLDDVLISQREEVKEEEEEHLQLLTFTLGGEEYALNIMDIKEIIKPKEVTEVPRSPDYILGIFSLRGTIIPVLDVNIRLGLSGNERGPQNRVIVVKYRDHFFGLHVDSVVQVLDIPISRIEPPPEILGGVEGEFLRGIGRIDERLIILLNLGRILKLDEDEGSGHLELPTG